MKYLLALFLAISLALSTAAQPVPASYTTPNFGVNTGYFGNKPITQNCHNFFTVVNNNPSIPPVTLSGGKWIIDQKQIELAVNVIGLTAPSATIRNVLYFPPGVYEVQSQQNINRHNVVIKGAGSSQTVFEWVGERTYFNPVNRYCFNVEGTTPFTNSQASVAAAIEDDQYVYTTTNLNASSGEWVVLLRWDNGVACGSDSRPLQFAKLASTGNTTHLLDRKLRISYGSADGGLISRLSPPGQNPVIQNVGFECFRIDATRNNKINRVGSELEGNIMFNWTLNCWMEGVESVKPAWQHVILNSSGHVDIRGCYFRQSHGYSSGEGYGISLRAGSNSCRIENNIFETVRHSVVIEKGANGNAIAYNYSRDCKDFWGGSDILSNGGGVFRNLLEGNHCEKIHFAKKGCSNGVNHVVFRNFISKRDIKVSNSSMNPDGDLAVIANVSTNCPSIGYMNNPDAWDNFKSDGTACTNWPGNNSNANGNSVLYSSRPSYIPANSWPTFGPLSPSGSNLPAFLRYSNPVKTVGNNCQECAAVPPPLVVTYNITPCNTDGIGHSFPGIIDLNISGGTPPYSTAWGSVLSGSPTYYAFFYSPMNWTATVTDANQQTVTVGGYTGPCDEGFFKSDGAEATANAAAFEATVYPNPFRGQTSLRIKMPESGPVAAAVYSTDGRKVMEVPIPSHLSAGTHAFALPFENFPAGLYFARISSKDQVRTIRLIVQ